MQREKLVIVNINGQIGRELCRLGVALGHEMISISPKGRPSLRIEDEPWIGGVTWIEADLQIFDVEEVLTNAFSITICAPPFELHNLKNAIKEYDVKRVVGVVLADRVGDFSYDGVSCRVYPLPITTSDDWEFSSEINTVHVSNLAMALLRLALEEKIPKELHGIELARFGDVMMIQ